MLYSKIKLNRVTFVRLITPILEIPKLVEVMSVLLFLVMEVIIILAMVDMAVVIVAIVEEIVVMVEVVVTCNVNFVQNLVMCLLFATL